jgi:16S rRNA (guanine527-N7)-methyltransferase
VRFGLESTAERSLLRLTDLLANDPDAPTTVRDPDRVIADHIADSLVALDLEPVKRAKRVVDIGSGAGLPGLPLAIAMPQTSFTLLESNRRKVQFLLRAVKECGIENASPEAERAETWCPGLGACDLATARAVADLDVLAEYAAPLLRQGGALVAWRGQRDAAAETRASRAAKILGLTIYPPVQVFPYPEARQRHLHVMEKVAETPGGFPRRPGMAAKRPLGIT